MKIKVKDLVNILGNETDIILIDNDTCEEMPNLTSEYADCDVLQFDGYTCDAVKVFIKKPTTRWGTYLNVTYSLFVEADVPNGDDPTDYLRKEADKEVHKLPDNIGFGGQFGSFHFWQDNIDDESFADGVMRV